MKCVKERSTDLITRVNDDRAHSLVKAGTHSYIAKKFWKQFKSKIEPIKLPVEEPYLNTPRGRMKPDGITPIEKPKRHIEKTIHASQTVKDKKARRGKK
jgi:hypothetical protein